MAMARPTRFFVANAFGESHRHGPDDAAQTTSMILLPIDEDERWS
jgi:hypothetical protein